MRPRVAGLARHRQADPSLAVRRSASGGGKAAATPSAVGELVRWLVLPRTAGCVALGLAIIATGVGVAGNAEAMRRALAETQAQESRRLALLDRRSKLVNELGAYSSYPRVDADARERLEMRAPILGGPVPLAGANRLVLHARGAILGSHRAIVDKRWAAQRLAPLPSLAPPARVQVPTTASAAPPSVVGELARRER